MSETPDGLCQLDYVLAVEVDNTTITDQSHVESPPGGHRKMTGVETGS